ncbi:hypothetical protein PAN31117_05427 [Pandoraea anapnoica]|uniref:Uncharacterized protein n=3 Tax=Pandoraea TaxID=93217 RepID=A0A5E5AUC4_9BURK|nr:hypothetical protein PAN31117_05427 [Pandoraea anapnoica]
MSLPQELRPVADSVPASAKTVANSRLTYRAVLTNAQGQIVYPDQHALDVAADNLPAAQLDDAMAAMLAPVIQAVRDGKTPDVAIEGLLEAYPDMDESQVAEILARAIFVADVWGRLNVD